MKLINSAAKTNWPFIAIVAFVGLLVGAGIFAFQDSLLSPDQQQSQQQGETLDTSDWQSYRNEKYGFEIRYPGEFLPKEIVPSQGTRPALISTIEVHPYFSIHIYDGKTEDNLLNWYRATLEEKEYSQGPEGQGEVDKKIEDIIVDNREVLKVSSSVVGYQKIRTFIDFGTYIISVEGSIPGPDVQTQDLETYQQILSSLQPLEEQGVDMSSWQTYRNEEYGFEVKYPESERELVKVNREYSDPQRVRVVDVVHPEDILPEDVISNPTSRFPFTGLNIFAGTDEVWFEECLTKQVRNYDADSNEVSYETVELEETRLFGGLTFYVLSSGQAGGSGTFAQRDQHRIAHNNTCYEISLMVMEVERWADKDPEWINTQREVNGQILSTFRFVE